MTEGLVSSKWGWLNQGTSTNKTTLSRLVLTAQASGNAAQNQWRLMVQAVPSGAWTVRARVSQYNTILNEGGGVVAYRSNSGDAFCQGILCRVAGAPTSARLLGLYPAGLNNGAVTAVRDDNPPLVETREWFMQMRYDPTPAGGPTLYCDYSPDNVQYANVTSELASTAIGGAPTSFGLFGNAPHATTAAVVSFDWFRVYSAANVNQT